MCVISLQFIDRLYLFVFRIFNPGVTDPITIKTHPFQQTSQPQEFNIGIASSAIFIGMDLVLVPITLAVDMVYDREVSYVKFTAWVYNVYSLQLSKYFSL